MTNGFAGVVNARDEKIEPAVAVEIAQREARAERRDQLASELIVELGFVDLPPERAGQRFRVGFDLDARVGFNEADVRRLFRNQVGLGAGAHDGLGVAPLLAVKISERRRVTRGPQSLKPPEHLLAFGALARAVQRLGEAVDCRRVVRLGFDRALERGDGLRILLFLRMDLADLDVGRGVSRVDREDFVEFRERFVVMLLVPERRRQRVMSVRAVGRELDAARASSTAARESFK